MIRDPICFVLGGLVVLLGCTTRDNAEPERTGSSKNEGVINMADTAGKFEDAAKAWEEHCRNVSFSSDFTDYLNHPAYYELIKMGRAAIPLIMQRYMANEPDAPWEFVLDEITGMNMIGNRERYSPAIVREKYMKWWNEKEEEEEKVPATKFDKNEANR